VEKKWLFYIITFLSAIPVESIMHLFKENKKYLYQIQFISHVIIPEN